MCDNGNCDMLGHCATTQLVTSALRDDHIQSGSHPLQLVTPCARREGDIIYHAYSNSVAQCAAVAAADAFCASDAIEAKKYNEERDAGDEPTRDQSNRRDGSAKEDTFASIATPLPAELLKQKSIHDTFRRASAVTNSFEIQAAFILHKKRPLNECEALRLFALFDLSETGKVTLMEVQRACSYVDGSREAHDIISKYRDTPLAHLRDRWAVKNIFDKIDVDQTGEISLVEWRGFLAELMLHDHDYLRRKGLAHFRAFFGKGRDRAQFATAEASSVPGCADRLRDQLYRVLGAAWVEDFWYYQKNHHPLLALFLADADNPLSRQDRLKIEFAVNSYNLFASTISITLATSRIARFGYSVAIVSVPMVLMRNVLLQLFMCPCLNVRNRHPTDCQRCCLDCLRGCGQGIGTLYVLGGVAFVVLGVLAALHFGRSFVLTWLFSWLLSYFLCILYDVGFTFNCLSMCVWLRRHWLRLLCLGATYRLRLAQWAIERDIVLQAMATAGAKSKSTDREGEDGVDGPVAADSGRRERRGSLWASWGGLMGGSWAVSSYRHRSYKETQVLPV
jgi:Ca2+-binding EF-hand superfamily protein